MHRRTISVKDPTRLAAVPVIMHGSCENSKKMAGNTKLEWCVSITSHTPFGVQLVADPNCLLEGSCFEPLNSVEAFTNWLRGLGGLRIFWAKPVERIEVVSCRPLIVEVLWRVRRRPKQALIMVTNDMGGLGKRIKEAFCSTNAPDNTQANYILITASEIPAELYDRRSIVYIYSTRDSRLLEPNWSINVEIREYHDLTGDLLRELRSIQKESWGFYIPPLENDVVFIARLNNEAVASAYYNPLSSNIDYGVHVVRRLWRRRIGTRILYEVLSYAKQLGRSWVSVVRVLRGRKPTTSDRRAMSFYEANNPQAKLNIYRLTVSAQHTQTSQLASTTPRQKAPSTS